MPRYLFLDRPGSESYVDAPSIIESQAALVPVDEDEVGRAGMVRGQQRLAIWANSIAGSVRDGLRPGAYSDQLQAVLRGTVAAVTGGQADPSAWTPEAVAAAAAALADPLPGEIDLVASQNLLAALRDLAGSTGELTPDQRADVDEALARSEEHRGSAVATARDAITTSRLRTTGSSTIDGTIRGLRAIAGDTMTANAIAAPLDPAVTGRYASEHLAGTVPRGVLPEDVRMRVASAVPQLRTLVDGEATPWDVMRVENRLQEIDRALGVHAAEQGVPHTPLPNLEQRSALLDQLWTARGEAVRATDADPESPEAVAARQAFCDVACRLTEAMGLVRQPDGTLVPPPRGDERPDLGSPIGALGQGDAVLQGALRRVFGRDETAAAAEPGGEPGSPGVVAGPAGRTTGTDPAPPADRSGPGVVVGGNPAPAPTVGDLRRATFPGGLPEEDPTAGAGRRIAPTPQPQEQFDPGSIGGFGEGPQPDLSGAESFPTGRQPDARDFVTTFPGASPRDQGEFAARPGSTRTDAAGREQTFVAQQPLVGSGSRATTPGTVRYFRDADGSGGSAVITPAWTDNGNGTRTAQIPNLGTSESFNPGARGVASVQRLDNPDARVGAGTTLRTVTVRDSARTVPLANGGTVTRVPVPGNPTLEDFTVTPSVQVSEVVHDDGSRTRTTTISALVPDGRELTMPSGQRFRVPAGTPAHPSVLQRTEFVPAPVVTDEPVGSTVGPDGNPDFSRRRGVTAGDAASNPERMLDRSPAGVVPQPPVRTSGWQRVRQAILDAPVAGYYPAGAGGFQGLGASRVVLQGLTWTATYDSRGDKIGGDAKAPGHVDPVFFPIPPAALDLVPAPGGAAGTVLRFAR